MESLVQKVFEKSLSGEGEPVETPTLEDSIQDEFGLDMKDASILIVGVGGAGNNMVSRLTDMGIKGATTVVMNTDVKHLSVSKADKKLLLGRETTRGLGAGGYPEVGRKAAEESEKDIKRMLEGVDMVYALCGLGGGTGTGCLPVLSKMAKEMGAISIACVTMPFKIEGARIRKAEDGLHQLRQVCVAVGGNAVRAVNHHEQDAHATTAILAVSVRIC